MERGQGEFTKLMPCIDDIDPDDAFSSVPYEKGFALLYHIQSVVGRAAFEAFSHDYIQTYRRKSITGEEFRAFAISYFIEGRHTLPRVPHWGAAAPPAPAAAASASIDISPRVIDWEAWLYAPGLPPVSNVHDGTARGLVEAAADACVRAATPDAAAAAHAAVAAAARTWAAPQFIAFLERLVSLSNDLAAETPRGAISPAVLLALDAAHGFFATRNSEIALPWLTLAVRAGIPAAVPAAVAFLRASGRMKYVRPTFRELLRTTLGRPAAQELFMAHASAYHPICAKMVAADLEVELKAPPVDPATIELVGIAPGT